jgi:hypothetical protein
MRMSPKIASTFGCLCLLIASVAIWLGCREDPDARVKEIAVALDTTALRNWAAGIVVSSEGDTNFAMQSPIFNELPPAVRSIPHDGMVGPTSIRVRDGCVELMWIDSWGHGFTIAVDPSTNRLRTYGLDRVLAPGIAYRPVNASSR